MDGLAVVIEGFGGCGQSAAVGWLIQASLLLTMLFSIMAPVTLIGGAAGGGVKQAAKWEGVGRGDADAFIIGVQDREAVDGDVIGVDDQAIRRAGSIDDGVGGRPWLAGSEAMMSRTTGCHRVGGAWRVLGGRVGSRLQDDVAGGRRFG